MNGYTFFATYILIADTVENLVEEEGNLPYGVEPPQNGLGYGNSKYVHCNYINKITIDSINPYMYEVLMAFPNISDFKFLNPVISGGTGFTANKIIALIQLVDNSEYDNLNEVRPISNNWKEYNLTNQIGAHIIGNNLTALELTNRVFRISLISYDQLPTYNLHDYINYPTNLNNTDLSFGDEIFFFGNVDADIKANVYTTDISVQLNLNEFNYSTNETWDEKNDEVYITEIGIYDNDYNLVGIGKLNNPIKKNNRISRNIVFQIDF